MVPDRSGLSTRFSVVPPSRDNTGVRQGQQETDDRSREQPRHKEVREEGGTSRGNFMNSKAINRRKSVSCQHI